MSGRITPAIRAIERAAVALRTFIDASASMLDQIVVNGGRRGLQIALSAADLILATSAVVVSLRT
jgi:Cys-tRNA(Pro)/Cys-tRNA(Cys) deacylase